MTPTPPENSRVKIVMDCCQFGLVRSPSKFQTPRIIITGRSRVPGGGGWWWCKVIIVSNPTRFRLDCGWVVVRLGFWQYLKLCPNKILLRPLHSLSGAMHTSIQDGFIFIVFLYADVQLYLLKLLKNLVWIWSKFWSWESNL